MLHSTSTALVAATIEKRILSSVKALATKFELGYEKYVKGYENIALINPWKTPYPDIPYLYGKIELKKVDTIINAIEFSQELVRN